MRTASIKEIFLGKRQATLALIIFLLSVLWANSAMVATIVSIAVTAPRTVLKVGETVQLTVIATLDDGSTIDVTAGSTGTLYFSSSPSATSVDADGLVTLFSTEARSIGWLEFFNLIVTNGSARDAIELRIIQEDADGDKVSDAWETEHGLNPSDPTDSDQDPDRDGLTNFEEFRTGTDPQNPDTDGDGALDGEEIRRGADPLNPKSVFEINQNCTVAILNRTAQVKPDGSWILPNVPANIGQVRARATCVQDGITVSGQSDFFTIPVNGSVDVPEIQLGVVDPIPENLTISAPATTLIGGQPCLVAILTFLSFRIPSCSLPILICNYLSSSSCTSSFRNPRLITPGSRFIYWATSTNQSLAAKSGWQLFKELKVEFSIIVITENHLPLITATHRMIQGSRKMDSGFSRHETSISPISSN